MIACVSPANTNINETLSTLDNVYRARSIQNKAIRNPNPISSKRQKWESELEQLQLQLKDKDRKIKELEEKVMKMEEFMTRMRSREEIQGPWSTWISNTEDFIT